MKQVQRSTNHANAKRTWKTAVVALSTFLSLSACGSDPDTSAGRAACGEGDDECQSPPEAFKSLDVTTMRLAYDLSQPVYVNNHVPIEFGITATSVDPAEPARRNVAVGFSFIEANPQDPANPIECGSSAIDVRVVADGEQHMFSGRIWPTSLCSALVGKPVNLAVSFDGGPEAEVGVDFPDVIFSEANRELEPNRRCRGEGASAPTGCVFAIDMQSTPSDDSSTLIDVRYMELAPASSVAILPALPPPDSTEGLAPSLYVESSLLVNGRDPYRSVLRPELVPPELEAIAPGITDDLQFGSAGDPGLFTKLPGRAVLRYELSPSDDQQTWLPLTMDAPGEQAGRVHEFVIEELDPGTSNLFGHELYAEAETRAALEQGGVWANVSQYTLRGCFEADFAQRGNEGDGATGDCRTQEITLVRERPAASAALAISFTSELGRDVGSDRIGVSTSLFTTNTLDTSGAHSLVGGSIDLRGKLGKSFSLNVARAEGEAHIQLGDDSLTWETRVDAFGKRIYAEGEIRKKDKKEKTDGGVPNAQEEQDAGSELPDEEIEVELDLADLELSQVQEFSAAKSFDIGGLGFGFGPVRVGFKFRAGGELGFEPADSLALITDKARCGELLGSDSPMQLCGRLSRTTTPRFAFTASIEGGIDVRIVKAGVAAELTLAETMLPLETALTLGRAADGKISVVGSALWKLEFQLLRGDVSIVGRVGIRRFSRSLKVHLFSFSSKTHSLTLLDRKLDVLEVLQ